MNVALVAPAGTVTVAGTLAADLSLLARVTEVLAEEAAVKATVATAEPPPLTEAGLIVSEARLTAIIGAITVKVAVWVAPPNDAEIVTV